MRSKDPGSQMGPFYSEVGTIEIETTIDREYRPPRSVRGTSSSMDASSGARTLSFSRRTYASPRLILRKRSASGVDVQRLSIGLDPTIRLVFSRRGDKSSRLVTDIPVFSQRQATVIG